MDIFKKVLISRISENMSRILSVIFLSLLMMSKFAVAIFFHEPSVTPIHPLHKNHSDFGFAMGYMSLKNKLVVGAPNDPVHGKVYVCDMHSANESIEIYCDDMLIHIPPSSRSNLTVNFHLGASIAATSEHFLTCAPLWTIDMKIKPTSYHKEPEVIGKCFFDGDYKLYTGTYEKYVRASKSGRPQNVPPIKTFVGGTGWTTLADEANDVMLVVKSSLEGDIVTSPSSNNNLNMNSMVLDKSNAGLSIFKYFNLGFGIAAGKFFSNKTVYAFNMETQDMRGVVEFLDYNPPHLKLMNPNMDMMMYTIQARGIATKFGSVLAASDMNKDGWDDLLVSEPLYTEEDCVDCGALHIYLGGEMETIGKKNYLKIFGIDNFGRFGSAIAVKDLDRDGVAELSVSAPYADEGLGVVYIISGYEVNQKLKQNQKLHLELTELKNTQRIQKESFRTLGFSLQFISDTDDNGCSELVVGAPGSGEALMLKCVQVINITLASNLIGEKVVREQDSNFTVQVCVEVKYPKKPKEISAHILLRNRIIGEGVSISNPEIEVDISCNNCTDQKFYRNVLIELSAKEPGDYTFKSRAELITGHIFNSTVFNTSWVVSAPYSTLQTREYISRHCRGDDCNPNLSMELFWSRRKEDPYIIGSSTTETMVIQIFNDGHSSYDACVWVIVTGAQLSRLLDHNECREENNGYTCNLPNRPLKRDQKVDIKLLLKMDRTNEFRQLEVKAYLHEKCSNEVTNNNTKVMVIPYVFNTDDIFVNGASHEKQYSPLQNKNGESYVMDVQEFEILNNGKITWKNVYAKISTKKTNIIGTFKATWGTFMCKVSDSDLDYVQICYLDVMPNSTVKIIVTTYILTTDLESHLTDNKLKVAYEIELHLTPTEEIKQKSIFTVCKFGTELAIGQNKLYIAIIAGVIGILILIVISIVLYKYGFFKREEKRKLLVHRESIKQRSYRRNTHISSAVDEQDIEGITDMDICDNGDDDCLFDKDVKTKTTNGDSIQIEERAQVHC